MVDIIDLKNRYDAIYGCEAVDERVVSNIEVQLGLTLPSDFKEISLFYSGGLLGGVSHHEIACIGDATNIVQETLTLRDAIGLQDNFIVIAEPSESLIVLNVAGNPSVIWCDAVEAKNLNSMNFANQPETWESYSDFFDYLIVEEEDE
ncbi:SMI1/KNR4 family protein [Motilimonas pumila]|uniref:SMI1/KNR4 family protein n=1 Tax=Motilimonas pumila TaxID=2303987 RepID=A0A418Y9F5_9GAMM|nr:SMI1/KNR4 family protein [Motilimonas pumila]RJG37254.1 SMI1/KNR4 family protein [Motilimonas pumila]